MSTAKKIDSDKMGQNSREYKWIKKILIVDDEPDIATSYKDILSPESEKKVVQIKSSRAKSSEKKDLITDNFELVVVNRPGEALVAVKEALKAGRPFAMGFFDVMLNDEIDGIELVKRIQELDSNMYSVFVTAYNDRSVDSIKNLLGEEKTGQWDYLNKPFSNGEILQKARNYVSLWNLKRERVSREQQLSTIQRRLLEAERISSVAAISRGVTHEFGNILMQIMGKADISRNKSEQDMQKALDVIVDASQRANKILEKFKNLSSSNTNDLPKEEYYLHEILDKALDLMEFQFKDHSVKVSRIKTERVKVSINSTSILQVLVNLTINAIHAMGDSGQIDFEIKDLGESGEIRIRDYGPGISQDLLDKVLQPFFTTKGSKGTGLGLSISNEIIQVEHGGEFLLRNHGLKGLEVIIRLPKKSQGENN